MLFFVGILQIYLVDLRLRIETIAALVSIGGVVVSVFLQLVAPGLGLERGIAITISLLIAGFSVLASINIVAMYRWNSINKIIKLLKISVDVSIKVVQDVNKEISSRNPRQPVTWNDVQQLMGHIIIPYLTQIGQRAFDIYFEDIKSTEEEIQKKRLMKKAKQGDITHNEAIKLKNLLEKQKKEKEQEGDLASAILLGLVLIFVIWLLTELAKPKSSRA